MSHPRPNWFCLPCRFTSKRGHTCPHCRQPMECAGHKWRLPRKTDDKGWAKLVGLIQWKRRCGYTADTSPTHSSNDPGPSTYKLTVKVQAERAYRNSTYERDRLKRQAALKILRFGA